MTVPYGGPYRIVCREDNGYFVCKLDGTKSPEYPDSASDELIGLVKRANVLEAFTSNSHVQPTEETQFFSIVDDRPSIQGDGSQEYLLHWTNGERTWTHESDITNADVLTLYRQRTGANEGSQGKRSQHQRAAESAQGGGPKQVLLIPRDTPAFLALKHAPPTHHRDKDQTLGRIATIEMRFPMPS
ncbi:hypothetical protein SARC_01781 [Sphaeroforma arctica JP610]|uniref:Chromo domain-containing protein n=1 Tax=Sphaeroforma arctica JP610 TaxID=667725 RepID=A0A0L0GAK7_9EUKA|nr:hypothetical protein SARC_01781 [Sphaeroforma arctica JP610]KNC86057.1 hypothetical protein SARC_01781 [Sphaeroforma arctica JP610]|eukprot:XP_014159959.1 hypothetical protein SARC_01781 [Sphaeroforma arctica JP610]